MADDKPLPIIVKRRRAHAHAHHGGAWKVAYADMVTALMALFIVLWILAQSEEVRAHIAGYFNDPQGFLSEAASRSIEGGSQASQLSIEPDTPPPPPPS
jgi:chemotaxis protein MotB